jgi:hypothetical protein
VTDQKDLQDLRDERDTVHDETAHDDTIHDETVHDETAHDDTVHEEADRGETDRDDTVHDETVHDETARDDTVSEDAYEYQAPDPDDSRESAEDRSVPSTDVAAALGASFMPGTVTGTAMVPPAVYESTDSPARDAEHAERAEAAERAERGEAPREMMPGEASDAPAAVLWDEATVEDLRDRWQAVQLRFVDDPRAAVDEAEALVREAAEALTTALTTRREELSRWRSAEGDDTEQLRVAVQRYREFLDGVLRA